MRKVSNRNFIIILAFLVGIVGGLMASVLKRLTHFIATSIQNDIDWKLKYSLYLVFPLIGILLSVLFVRKFIKGKKHLSRTLDTNGENRLFRRLLGK
ncbi:hypothetical protein [Sphingobacterium siyangense]|uniref:hypothetical protein n=2 Tax=Sphingobacteriaceae TaxID=84566 RepID=UPI003DA2171E